MPDRIDPLQLHATLEKRRIARWLRAETHGRARATGYVFDRKGEQWFTKAIPAATLLAEHLGSTLATKLGIPIPDFAIAEHALPTPIPGWAKAPQNHIRWMSRYQANALPWRREVLLELNNPGDLGRILALDAVLHITDRHKRNVLLIPTATRHFRIMVIDYDAGPAGSPEVFWDLAQSQSVPSPKSLLNHGLVVTPKMQAAAMAAADHMENAAPTLSGIASASCKIADMSDQAETLSQALLTRMKDARSLVYRYLEQVRRTAP